MTSKQSKSKTADGKKFESRFKHSMPDYCLVQRLNDQPQSFQQRSDTRFTLKYPCDFLIFDSKHKLLYCIECKSTKYNSISFEDELSQKKNETKMIHWHQIEGLRKYAEFDNVVAGFVYNFRDEKNDMERTYFQNIKDFEKMRKSINKKSLNEMDIILNNGYKINGEKKRIYYTWDMNTLLNTISEKMKEV